MLEQKRQIEELQKSQFGGYGWESNESGTNEEDFGGDSGDEFYIGRLATLGGTDVKDGLRGASVRVKGAGVDGFLEREVVRIFADGAVGPKFSVKISSLGILLAPSASTRSLATAVVSIACMGTLSARMSWMTMWQRN